MLVSHLQSEELRTVFEATSSSSPLGQQRILFWDSIFHCAGLDALTLKDYIDIPQWMMASIGPLLAVMLSSKMAGAVDVDGTPAQVMRRRLLWLLSCLSYHIPQELLPHVLSLLFSVLDHTTRSSDTVTMIQATQTLGAIIETYSFHSSMLVGSFPALVQSLCALTLQLESCEARSSVVDLIGQLLLKMGVRIRPILQPVALHLHTLWTSAEAMSPVRNSVLEALSHMVRSAGASSDSLEPLVLPMLVTIFNQEDTGVWREAKELWLGLVRAASAYSLDMDALFKVVMPIIVSVDSEDLVPGSSAELRTLMMITEAYALLGRETFLQSSSEILAAILHQCLGSQLESKTVSVVRRPLDALFFAAPAAAAAFVCRSGVLAAMLRTCGAAMDNFKMYFPDFGEKPVVLVAFLSVVCRSLTIAPAALHEQIAGVLQQVGVQGGESFFQQGLFRLLVDNFDKVEGLWDKRLWLRTMLGMYPSADPSLVSSLSEVCQHGVSLLISISSDKEEDVIAVNTRRDMETFGDSCPKRFDDEDNAPGPEATTTIYKAMVVADPITSIDFQVGLVFTRFLMHTQF